MPALSALVFWLLFSSTAAAAALDLQRVEKLAIVSDERSAELGTAVAAGDFDGDGIDDLVVSSPGSNGTGEESHDAGQVYIYFGDPGRGGSDEALSPAGADVVLFGEGAKNRIGLRLATGDLDGDGRDEIVAGTMYGDGPEDDRLGCGEALVFFGRPRGEFPRHIDLAETEADITVYGAEKNDFLAGEIGTGDLDGDGRDDLILGAFYGDGPAGKRHHAGEVSILFGGAREDLPHTVDLAAESLPTIYGPEATDTFGRSIAAGDVDGDGRDDLVAGAYYGDGPANDRINSGETFLIFGGPRERFPQRLDLAEQPPHVIYGEHDGDVSGRSVAVVDLDGDGRKEIAISGHSASPEPEREPQNSAGIVYVLFGRSEDDFGDLLDLRRRADVKIAGRWDGDNLGWPLVAGPWEGGREALLAIARGSDGGSIDRPSAGEAFLLQGRDGRADFDPAVDVVALAAFSLIGMDEGDRLASDGAILDWNGDGKPEIALGVPHGGGPHNQTPSAGEVIVYFAP